MHRSLRRTLSTTLPLLLATSLVLALPATPAAAATCKAGTPSDFNGDGHSDVAIAEPFPGFRVHVIYGTAHGLVAGASGTALDDQLLADPNGETQFGDALATGDFNGDGCADLAVGDPDVSFTGATSAGVVDVYFGSPSGLVFGHRLTSHSIGLSLVGEDGFGLALATGDFNHDNLADLVIGAPNDFDGLPNQGVGAGSIYIVPGSKDGTFTGAKRFTQGDGKVPGTSENDDRFGSSLTTGDFNGDHITDVAIGDQGENGASGAVDVLRGSGTSAMLTATGAKGWTQDTTGIPGTSEANDLFGFSVAAGDFNGDGKADLAVGVPGEAVGTDFNAGTVDVIYGSGSGLTATDSQAWTLDSTGVVGSAANGGDFGYAVAAGDFNGNGKTDLAVGVPSGPVGSVSAAGFVDVLIGATGGLTGTGSTSWSQATTGIGGTAENNDGFGLTLYATRIRSASRDDLVVGVPSEQLGQATDAGAVNVIASSSSGLTATGSQLFTDGTAGIKGAVCGSCNFGFTIA